MKTMFASLVVVGLGLAGTAFYTSQPASLAPEPPPSLTTAKANCGNQIFRTPAKGTVKLEEVDSSLPTAKVKRGNLIRTVPAKGIVKLDEVEVGTQITGRIASFGRDPANPSKPLDCGSRVSKGAILAQIDATIYKAQVDYAEAAISAAKANLVQLQARRDQTEQEWKRAKSLQPAKAIAESDYDLASTNFRMAEANVRVGEAAVRESEASLRMAKTNLDYTVIRSPDDGVIIERRVAVGQTVAMVPGFNAPGLFLIAKDSQQVQVWASVSEADIGYIQPGGPVQFTINACLDESFEGKVSQVRMSPTIQGDAVTYTVVVVANSMGSLLRDMTANLLFEIDRRANVLLIPNDALKRLPQLPQTLSEVPTMALNGEFNQAADKKVVSMTKPGDIGKKAKLRKSRRADRQFWIKDGDLVRPIDVQIGFSNESMTEVTGVNLKEGMEVILAEVCLRDGN